MTERLCIRCKRPATRQTVIDVAVGPLAFCSALCEQLWAQAAAGAGGMAPVTDIITITEADLARLQSWEFEEVWRAVGYVYRRRAEASKALPAVPPAIEPAPVPLAPVEAPPDVPPGRAPGEKEGAKTVVLEPGSPAEPVPTAHVHRYKLGSPAGDSVEGLCECGHRKLHPADLNGDISRNGKRSPNPKCPQCGKHALRDRHGYWCNGCQLEVLAS